MSSSRRDHTGRFAPSPTGALHFGSLLAALASYLDARAAGGRWLLRMEDLDPGREQRGAADHILQTLQAMGLQWDGEVLYQSRRLEAYAEALEQLRDRGLVYRCDCNRRRIRSLGGVYDGHCRDRSISPDRQCALRLRVTDETIRFPDVIQGETCQSLEQECGDFVIRRKDGLFAYQLAVVVDDAFQGISHVLRGADLLDSTPRQIHLQRTLALPGPAYAHIPVAANPDGSKLSKQHLARPLDRDHAGGHLARALAVLGQQPPPALERETPEMILEWARTNWDIQKVPRLSTIPVE